MSFLIPFFMHFLIATFLHFIIAVDIDAAREEIEFLTEEQQRAEAGRCPVCGRSGAGARRTRRGKEVR